MCMLVAFELALVVVLWPFMVVWHYPTKNKSTRRVDAQKDGEVPFRIGSNATENERDVSAPAII